MTQDVLSMERALVISQVVWFKGSVERKCNGLSSSSLDISRVS